MEKTTTHTMFSEYRSIKIGVIAVLATLVIGFVVAYATGITNPMVAKAFDPAPPCCVFTPIMPPILIQPPTFTPAPPCCTETAPPPAVTPPPTFTPAPPCCTETPPVVTTPPTNFTPAPPCCTEITPPVIELPPTFTPAPPCCTEILPPVVVIIPPTTVIPPVIIPPVTPPTPPVTPEARCISLTGSTAGPIAPGAAVTLTWDTLNTDTITIDNGVGTFSTATTSSGHVVVNPTTTTTYVGTVSNGSQSVHCQATVTVVPTTTGGSSCISLVPSPSDVATNPIAPGTAVVLTWTTQNASVVTITDNTGAIIATSSAATGSVTVNPQSNNLYSAQADHEAIKTACQAPVKITTGGGGCTSNCGGGGGGCTTNCGGGGGGGGGGGSPSPNVFFSSRQAPPLSSVYLSQIPYTGLDLGPVGTVVYWLMLVIWSLAAAYLILFGGLPVMRRKIVGFSSSVRDSLDNDLADNTPDHIETAEEVISHSAPTSHQAIHDAAVAHVLPEVSKPAASHNVQYATVAPSRAEMTGQGFKAFAQGGALTIDDIVKGLSRESGMEFSTETSAPAHAPALREVVIETTTVHAPDPVVYAAPIIPPAPRAEAPQRHAAPAAAPVHAEVPTFITAILNGERDVVFGIIRSMNQAGHDVEDFMAQAICALDDAYRARIDGTPVHSDVKLVTDGLATPFLERLVTSLTTAVDGSYSMGVTGIKLALTRALAVAQG